MLGLSREFRLWLALALAAWVVGYGADAPEPGRVDAAGPERERGAAFGSALEVAQAGGLDEPTLGARESPKGAAACPVEPTSRWDCERAGFPRVACHALVPAETFAITGAGVDPALCRISLRAPARVHLVATVEGGRVVVKDATGTTRFEGANHVETLNAALASLCGGGGVLELGPGEYRRTSRAPLSVTCDDVAVLGRPGATLDQQADSSDSLVRVSTYSPSSKAVRGPQVRNVTIAGLTLLQSVEQGDALTLAGTEDGVVLFNEIVRSGEEAIAVYNSNGTVVLANRVKAGGTIDDGKTLTASLQCLGCTRFVFGGNVIDNRGAAPNTSALQISHGLAWRPSTQGRLVANVIEHSTSIAVHLAQGTRDVLVEDLVVLSSDRSCLRIDNRVGREPTGAIRVAGGSFASCAGVGLEILADDVELADVRVEGTGKACIRQARQDRLLVIGALLNRCGGHAISAVHATRLALRESTFAGMPVARNATGIVLADNVILSVDDEATPIVLDNRETHAAADRVFDLNVVTGPANAERLRLRRAVNVVLVSHAVAVGRPLVIEDAENVFSAF